MPRTTEGDEDDDWDEPGEFEYSPEADDPGGFWCPKCGAEMYGDSPRCARCGDYVTPGLKPRSAMPGWMWVGLVLVGLTLVAGLVAMALR